MFCKQCGSEIPEDALFCTNCGAKLEKEEPKAEEKTYDRPIIDMTDDGAPASFEAPAFEEAPEASGADSGSYEVPGQPVYSAPQQPVPAGEAPKDYLVVNIILTVISVLSCCSCCSMISLILSIIGIVFSSQTKKAVEAGDLKTAQEKSRTAKIMWIISVIMLGISLLVSVIAVASGAYASLMSDLGGLDSILP